MVPVLRSPTGCGTPARLRSQRNLGNTVSGFGIGYPNTSIREVKLVLFHGQQLLEYSQTRFRDDGHDVAQVRGCMSLNSLLFGPRHVVRPKQALNANRELHAQARVCKQQLLPYGYVQHAPEHANLLVHGGRLQDVAFPIAKCGLDLNTLTKTTPQVQFDLVGGDVNEFAHAKDRLEVFRDSHVDFVRTVCAEGRLRIILQKEVGPLPEAQMGVRRKPASAATTSGSLSSSRTPLLGFGPLRTGRDSFPSSGSSTSSAPLSGTRFGYRKT